MTSKTGTYDINPSIDRQELINACEGHARYYMRAIFEEVIDHGLLDKNPARKLALPAELKRKVRPY